MGLDTSPPRYTPQSCARIPRQWLEKLGRLARNRLHCSIQNGVSFFYQGSCLCSQALPGNFALMIYPVIHMHHTKTVAGKVGETGLATVPSLRITENFCHMKIPERLFISNILRAKQTINPGKVVPIIYRVALVTSTCVRVGKVGLIILATAERPGSLGRHH